jgi:hypothetical protein
MVPAKDACVLQTLRYLFSPEAKIFATVLTFRAFNFYERLFPPNLGVHVGE